MSPSLSCRVALGALAAAGIRAVVVAAVLAGGVATAYPASAEPLPCRAYVYPPEFYYTPWGQLGYVNVAPPYVDCS